MSAREKREIIETAAECAREYRAFVRAGVLIDLSSGRRRRIPDGFSAENENEDWAGASAALKAFGLGGLSDVIDFLSSSRPVKPWSRRPLLHQPPVAAAPGQERRGVGSAMKARLKSAENAGGPPPPRPRAPSPPRSTPSRRCSRGAAATRGGRRRPGTTTARGWWTARARGAADVAAHGSLNGKKLPGTPAVPCLRALSGRRARREENGDAPAAVSARPRWSRRTTPRTPRGAARTRARGLGGLGRADDDDDERQRFAPRRARDARARGRTEDPPAGRASRREQTRRRTHAAARRNGHGVIDAVAEDF